MPAHWARRWSVKMPPGVVASQRAGRQLPKKLFGLLRVHRITGTVMIRDPQHFFGKKHCSEVYDAHLPQIAGMTDTEELGFLRGSKPRVPGCIIRQPSSRNRVPCLQIRT